MSLGLCIGPNHVPGPGSLSTLNPPFLRSILYGLDDLDVLMATGRPLLVTLNNECEDVGGDWSGWQRTVEAIANRAGGRVFGICVGNEFDSWWQHDENDVPPSFAARLVRGAARILRPYGIKTIATSVVSPRWPEYLQRMADLCRDDADYFDLHAYGQRPSNWKTPGWGNGELIDALVSARSIAGKPVAMSEIGITLEMAGGESLVPQYMDAVADDIATLGTDICPFAAYFAYHDGLGKPEERGPRAFGLVAEDGRPRPAFNMYAVLNAAAPDPIEPIPPEPEPVPSNEPPIVGAWRLIWQAAVPSLPYDERIHGHGIPTYWRTHIDEMGSPLGPEIADQDGTVIQSFALGVWRWTGSECVKVTG